MKVSEKIKQQLATIPEGITFGYEDLSIEDWEYRAAAKKIERYVSDGTLERQSKGIFYKPKQTVFGALQPREDELLKQYLFKKGQRIAYITGASLYNEMGLTTQIPFTIVLASKSRRSTLLVIGNLKIKPVRSYADVTNDNYHLLGILDAIKDFNTISDMNRQSGITILTNKLKTLTPQQILEIIECALSYRPRVRSLLGAILELMDSSLDLTVLKKSLKPLSKYKWGITAKILPNATKWNII